ncbi:MAG: uroporphyrinogen decarboxylase family protein, partial [Armatimonadota bacterium]
MTPRETALRALSFEEIGRVPVAGGLMQHVPFMAGVLGISEAQWWEAPRANLFAACREIGCHAILGPVMPKQHDATTTDAQGRPTDFTHRAKRPDMLTTPEEVAEYARNAPSPEQVRARFDAAEAEAEYRRRTVDTAREAGEMLVIPHILGWAPRFPTSDSEFSYEAFLMACALHTEDMARLFRSWGETSRLRFEAVARVVERHDLPRIAWIGQDICERNGSVLSPALLERLYFPQLEYAIEPLKCAGMKVIWHSDANYREILPMLVTLGIDGVQGLYESPRGMRLEEVAAIRTPAGNPLIIFGSVSTHLVLPQGSVEDVEAAVDRCIDIARGRGGVLIAPSSSIGPEVPPQNIAVMYRRVQERNAE